MNRRTFIAALVFAILFAGVTYAVNPSSPFRPSQNIQDPDCDPILDNNCYVTYGVETQSNGTSLYTDTKTINFGSGLTATDNTNGTITITAAGGAATWGSITGTLANQTDLQDELDDKLENISGLVTAGTNITVTGSGTSGSPYVVSGPTISPITVGTTGTTLYSSGLSGTGQGGVGGQNIFLGVSAGASATNAASSNFIGASAGNSAASVQYANFIGFAAGAASGNASNSNFIGVNTGANANNASNSNFIGTYAGYNQYNSPYSNIFGYYAGALSAGNLLGANNIIIGTNISLPGGTSNAINLGGVLFGTGTYSTTTGDPSITSQTGGRIGIAVVSPAATLDVNGDAILSGTSRYLNFGTTAGTSGYGFRNNAGIMEYKNNGGSWASFGGGSSLALYRENPVAATTPTATGSNAFAIGSSANAGSSNAISIGTGAGSTSSGASATISIGVQAGSGAFGALSSNFIGSNAGQSASSVMNSNFFGSNTGLGATTASNSIFMGTQAGQSDTVNNNAVYNDSTTFANYSILLGHKTSTGGFSNSIGLGAYATNTATNQLMLGSTNRPINQVVINGTSPYLNFSGTAGSSGYGIRNNAGIMEYKNNGGSWASIGGGGGGGSIFLQTDGVLNGSQGTLNLISGSNITLTDDGSGAVTIDASGDVSPITIVNGNSLFSTGLSAGTSSTAANSIFLGVSAGSGALSASFSNFIGLTAGQNASGATYSNFIGVGTGANASNAINSNFIGTYAGGSATNANNSIFIGTSAGYQDTVNNTSNGLSSILLGSYTKTGGFSNSILIGSGTDPNNGGTVISNTAANQFMLADSITNVRWRGIEYELPSAQAAASGYVLTNDGTGVLTWTAGGGASATLLQTDEVTNAEQSILNLTAGSNINLTDNGDGTIVIASTGGSSQWTNVSGGINYANGIVGINNATPNAFLDIKGGSGSGGGGYEYNQYVASDIYPDGFATDPVLNDATFSGTYTGDEDNVVIQLFIDTSDTVDTFSWQMIEGTITGYQDYQNLNVIDSGTSVPITGGPQLLANGISVTFENLSGHDDGGGGGTGDAWFYGITSPGIYYQDINPDDLNGMPSQDDATFSGAFTGDEGSYFLTAVIDNEDIPDTFEWTLYQGTMFEFLFGAATVVDSGSSVAITGTSQLLSNGMSITFGDTTGHTNGDAWGYAISNNGEGSGGGVAFADLINASTAAGNSLFKVTGAGKVGIGQGTPVAMLDIKGVGGYYYREVPNDDATLNDITFSGTYTGSGTGVVFRVFIDSEGAPDTFSWEKRTINNVLGSGTITSSVPITGTPQLLEDGISVTFENTTGHDADDGLDSWTYLVVSPGLHTFDTAPAGFDPITDATFSGTLSQDVDDGVYILFTSIDGTGTPDTFSWCLNSIEDPFLSNCIGLGANVDITGAPQLLSSGISINFENITGHNPGDAYARLFFVNRNTQSGDDLFVAQNSSGNGLFKIDSNGKVGIGRSTPNAYLDIQAGEETASSGYIYEQIEGIEYGGVPDLDDATFSGAYTNTEDNVVVIVSIDSEGAPDTFEWNMYPGTIEYYDDTNPIGGASGVPITGSPQLLANGISVDFGATTGHTAFNDAWLYNITSSGVFYTNVDSSVWAPSFEDVTITGTYTGNETALAVDIEIDDTTGPDTFTWSFTTIPTTYDNGDGDIIDGVSGVAITPGVPQLLANGMYVTFNNDTAHTIGDHYAQVIVDNGGSSTSYTDLVNARNFSGTSLFRVDGSGNLALSGTDPYINFSSTTGESGYGFRNNSGVMEFKDDGGMWTAFSSGGGFSPISVLGGTNLVSTGITGSGNGTDTSDSIFFGQNAGNAATNANNSIFMGASAGAGAENAENSNFFGYETGHDAVYATNSNFFGQYAGNSATNAYLSNFMGPGAGVDATYATRSNFFGPDAGNGAGTSPDYDGDVTGDYFDANFFGYRAGYQAENALASNFIGVFAGSGATNAMLSNFIGASAGSGATSAAYSIFIGTSAGSGAENAAGSTFIGKDAGNGAIDAGVSTFIGQNAGANAVSASHSIFIGTDAGLNDSVDNSTLFSSSILIGDNTSTGGFSNSIALGAFATNTAENQFMIGAGTNPIDELVILGSGSQSCSIRPDTPGISCSSDEQLKTNIADLVGNDTLKNLLSVRTVTYNWNNTPDSNPQTGFIAQDLQKYFPTLVSESATGYLQVNYAGMTPILTKAIQEMNLNIVGIADLERENTWRDSLVAWFADTGNGIANIFSKKVTTDELCVRDEEGETCLTRAQINSLLNGTNGSSNGGGDTDSEPEIPAEEEPVDPAPTEEVPVDPDPETPTDPAPEPTEPDPTPETPVVEDEPEPESTPENDPEPAPETPAPADTSAE